MAGTTLPIHLVLIEDNKIATGVHQILNETNPGNIRCEKTQFYFNKLTFQRKSIEVNVTIESSNAKHEDSNLLNHLNQLMDHKNITGLLEKMNASSNHIYEDMTKFLQSDNQTISGVSYQTTNSIKNTQYP